MIISYLYGRSLVRFRADLHICAAASVSYVMFHMNILTQPHHHSESDVHIQKSHTHTNTHIQAQVTRAKVIFSPVLTLSCQRGCSVFPPEIFAAGTLLRCAWKHLKRLKTGLWMCASVSYKYGQPTVKISVQLQLSMKIKP